jgi:hypothetical protein
MSATATQTYAAPPANAYTATTLGDLPEDPVAPGGKMKLLGEVVTWECRAGAIPYAAIKSSLQQAGLDGTVARQMVPRNAFRRAARQLSRDRIIKVLRETAGEVTFQFTQEHLDANAGHYAYSHETDLTLDKDTGTVSCPLGSLRQDAQTLVDHHVAHRRPGDVTGIIQRLFRRNADLFAIRDKGSVYFVPARHAEFTARVEAFLAGVGGLLSRFPVPAGTPTGDRAVKKAVGEGMAELVRDHAEAIAQLRLDQSDGTFERAAKRIKETRFKLEAYAAYLEAAGPKLRGELDRLTDELRQKAHDATKARSEADAANRAEGHTEAAPAGEAVTA